MPPNELTVTTPQPVAPSRQPSGSPPATGPGGTVHPQYPSAQKQQALAEIDRIRAKAPFGTEAYKREAPRLRKLYEQAYPDPDRAPKPDNFQIRERPRYNPTEHSSDDPALAKYVPPGDVTFGDADWMIWDAVRPVAHSEGVTPRQLAALTSAVKRFAADENDAIFEHADKQAEAELRGRYGKELPQALRDAKAAADEYGDAGFSDFLEKEVPGAPGLKFGSLPSLVDMLARVGKTMRGGTTTFRPLAPHDDDEPATPASHLKAEVEALQAKYPIWRRPRAVDQQIQKLYRKLYPNET